MIYFSVRVFFTVKERGTEENDHIGTVLVIMASLIVMTMWLVMITAVEMVVLLEMD